LQSKLIGACAKQPESTVAHLKEKKKKKKKKKKEKHFGHLVTFWFGTFAMLFSTTGCVVRREDTRR